METVSLNKVRIKRISLINTGIPSVGFPLLKNGSNPTPEEDVTDALVLEGGNGALLLDNGSYLKLESSPVSTMSTRSTTTKRRSTTSSKTNKTYWKFTK